MATLKSSTRSDEITAPGRRPKGGNRETANIDAGMSLYLQEIRQLCSSLLDLKKASAEEICAEVSMLTNTAFHSKTAKQWRSISLSLALSKHTSKEISDLEGELSSMKKLLSTQATLIHNLADGVHVDSLSDIDPDNVTHDTSNDETSEDSDLEKWSTEFPDYLDVLLAERRVDEALSSLDGRGTNSF
nr:exocyst complex component EXO84B [Ipomoea batatas]